MEIEVIVDSREGNGENNGENMAYDVAFNGLPLQRIERRLIDGDPTATDVYLLQDAAAQDADAAESADAAGNDNADGTGIVRISASAHDGAKITALRLHK